MFSHIMLSCGYAETSTVSWSIWSCNQEFASIKEAITSLALDLYESYKDLLPDPGHKDCCEQAKKTDAKYCPECGENYTLTSSTGIDFVGL